MISFSYLTYKLPWWFQVYLKNITVVNSDHFPNFGGENEQKCLKPPPSRVLEKYMAQPLHIGSYGLSTNLPFGICAIYFEQ